ncbi:MAG: hypothetical protein CL943_02855 [Candidatus Diapherotrites archaeon]|uniref:Uncharacterized protein n=1 Tax=Candidatus Iainarchaeum sp. TaxID=3101447 RepID=A0A2D6M1F2_9ARCH|nr:hypothetical protein [Candidatus Diapherotrites archaeon]|tara:strand:+ start:4334 stop:4963 length:630 start_codon:yes stop_codon:yes gene_type:complete
MFNKKAILGFLLLLLLFGCVQPGPEPEQPLPQDTEQVQDQEDLEPEPTLVRGRAEDLILSLDDFDEEFKFSQFEGAYSEDSTFIQQFKTFFKPQAYPIKPLDENTFVLTQTLTIINSSSAIQEITQLYETELSTEKEKRTITISETNFLGEKSILMVSILEGNDLYKVLIIEANTLHELSLLTIGMDEEQAKEKLKFYSQKAVEKIKAG